MRKYATLCLFIAGFTVAVPTALAGGKGGGTTSSSPSISIASLNGTTMNASTKTPTPYFTESVTWATTTGSLAGNATPEVALTCYQDLNHDGVVNTDPGGPDIVYAWVDNPSALFSFGGRGQTSTWSLSGGGAATCRADLVAYSVKGHTVLASTGDFPVSG
jgi:hypothetical protein